jgi:hypothetical protein
VLAAVVSTRRGRWSPRTRAAALRLSRQATIVIRVPHDPRLDSAAAGAGGPGEPGQDAVRAVPVRRMRRATRRAFVELAAAIVDTCVLAETAGGDGGEPARSPVRSGRGAGPALTAGVSSGDLAAGDGGEDR